MPHPLPCHTPYLALTPLALALTLALILALTPTRTLPIAQPGGTPLELLLMLSHPLRCYTPLSQPGGTPLELFEDFVDQLAQTFAAQATPDPRLVRVRVRVRVRVSPDLRRPGDP